MLDRRAPPEAPASADSRRPLDVARRVLAMIVVACGLLALATWYKHSACGCSGGLPYTTIGLWAGIAAAVALTVYLAIGYYARRINSKDVER